MNVTPVTGRGVQKGIAGAGPRGGTVVVDMLPKVKLELVVSDGDTQKALDTIIAYARTGNIGDGKIFVSPVANAIRVRTGEEGESGSVGSWHSVGSAYWEVQKPVNLRGVL